MNDRAEKTAWFKALILPHEPELRRRLHRMRVPDIEDVVAETLTRAFAAENWRRIDQGRAFVFQILRNLLIDAARRNSVVSIELVADLERLHLDDGRPGPEAVVTARDELRQLQKAIDALPPQARRVFLMRRVHELSPQEIAAEMKLSVSTVEKHLAKAMLAVTIALGHVEPPRAEALNEDQWRDTNTKR
ncbi:MAG TPA: RNA polymerase sigma factor [Caulobacteraceae bacterium]|nr:RNA polymerase sigma factor [Caulobacteraceae bacterium]